MSLIQNKIAYFPLKAILGFLIFTELLFWIGPNKYEVKYGVLLFFYLIILNVAFYVGYRNGVASFVPSKKTLSSFMIKFWLWSGLITSCISTYMFLQAHGWSFSVSTLVDSLTNPGEAYYSETEDSLLHASNIMSVLMSPLKWAALPIGIYYWKRLSSWYKSIVLVTLLLSLYCSLISGVRKGLFDIIIIGLFCVIARFPNVILNRAVFKKLKVIALLAVGLFLVYFIFSNISRYGGDSLDFLKTMKSSHLKQIYLDCLPFSLVMSLSFITGYLCQGYYALGTAFNYGIIMPSFFGSSFFLMRIANDIFGFDPLPDTYMYLLQKYDGINTTINWHTLYLWLANDVTFLFVPILIYFIGFFFSKTWCDSVYGKNVYAFPTMTLFLIMSVYSFANNQVLSFSFLPFCFWILTYYLTRKKA